MSVPIPNLSSTDQTSQAVTSNRRTAANIQPGGINLGAIMQHYQQPYEHGGAEIYPQSRLFDPVFNVEPYSKAGGVNFSTANLSNGGFAKNASLAIPVALALGAAYLILKG